MKQEFYRFMVSVDQRLRHIERNLSRDDTILPSQTAMNYVLNDLKYERMDTDKYISALSIALAEIYFGETVLSCSSLTRRSEERLDYRIINRIEDYKTKIFSSYSKRKDTSSHRNISYQHCHKMQIFKGEGSEEQSKKELAFVITCSLCRTENFIIFFSFFFQFHFM